MGTWLVCNVFLKTYCILETCSSGQCRVKAYASWSISDKSNALPNWTNWSYDVEFEIFLIYSVFQKIVLLSPTTIKVPIVVEDLLQIVQLPTSRFLVDKINSQCLFALFVKVFKKSSIFTFGVLRWKLEGGALSLRANKTEPPSWRNIKITKNFNFEKWIEWIEWIGF